MCVFHYTSREVYKRLDHFPTHSLLHIVDNFPTQSPNTYRILFLVSWSNTHADKAYRPNLFHHNDIIIHMQGPPPIFPQHILPFAPTFHVPTFHTPTFHAPTISTCTSLHCVADASEWKGRRRGGKAQGT